MVYTNIGEIESYLRTTFDASSSPTRADVLAMVTAVDSEVDSDRGTSWTIQTDGDDIFSMDVAKHEFLPRKLPVNSVSTVYTNSNTDKFKTPVWEDITADNWYLRDNLIITKSNYDGDQNVRITYNWGFNGATEDVKNLAKLFVVKKIMSSEDSSNNQFTQTRIGPIDTKRSIGVNRFINIDNEIRKLQKKIGSFKNITG